MPVCDDADRDERNFRFRRRARRAMAFHIDGLGGVALEQRLFLFDRIDDLVRAEDRYVPRREFVRRRDEALVGDDDIALRRDDALAEHDIAAFERRIETAAKPCADDRPGAVAQKSLRDFLGAIGIGARDAEADLALVDPRRLHARAHRDSFRFQAADDSDKSAHAALRRFNKIAAALSPDLTDPSMVAGTPVAV